MSEWAWAPDGSRVTITESSEYGIVSVRTLHLDPSGRLLCLEAARGGPGAAERRLDVTWSPDGRILSARGARHAIRTCAR